MSSYIQGSFSVGGYPQDGATTNLYPSSVFTSPPSGGNLSGTGTALPNSSNRLATTTTGPQHGSNGAYRFAVASSGSWWVGISWNGYNEWFFHSLPGSSPATLMDYGAVGDGIANDTAAVQAAALTNQRIRVPIGTFLCSDTIDLNGAYFVGDGWGTANAQAKAKFLFQNLGTKPAFRTTQASTLTRTVGVEGVYVSANSWDATSGCLGYGFDIEAQITLKNVYCQGFKKSNLFLHNDVVGNGPYQSYIENFFSAYAGQHGIVNGTGANTVTYVNCRSFYSGASGFLSAPGASGLYDGFYVDYANEGNPGSAYFSYNPQAVTVIGGDCSNNSRYGWNFRGVRESFVSPGYAEGNFAAQANIGLNVGYVDFHFQTLNGDEAGLHSDRNFSTDDSDVSVWIGGKYVGSGSNDHASKILTNFDIYLLDNGADVVHIRPKSWSAAIPPATTDTVCLFSTFGNAVLQIGANTHVLAVSGNMVRLPDKYFHGNLQRNDSTSAPVAGTFNQGDFYWNNTPASGAPFGWACVTAGSPGTWLPAGHIPNIRTQVTASGSFSSTDLILLHNASAVGGTKEVILPASPYPGVVYRVKDAKGDAGTNRIDIIPAPGTGSIDGSTSATITTNFGAKSFTYDSANWFTI